MIANDGLNVNTLGNAVFNVSGSANVSVPGSIGTSALVIGGDILGTTGGTVNLSGGTLAVGGDLVLGNAGIGTLVRSGGVFSGGGNLVASGAGTLILNGSAASVATYFSGKLKHNGDGTLIVIPVNNLLGGNESLSFGVSSSLSSHAQGIVGAWAVAEASGSDSTGDYVTLIPSSGTYSLGTASYTGTDLTSSSGSDVISLTGSSNALSTSTSAYAVKFGNGSTTMVNGTLTLISAGMILDGATISGSGNINLYGKPGLIFVGSATASTLGVPLVTSLGVTKFGPGTLILTNSTPDSQFGGGMVITGGVVNVQTSQALGIGGGNEVLVTAGAELDLQNNVGLPGVLLSISGSGVSGGGASATYRTIIPWAGR